MERYNRWMRIAANLAILLGVLSCSGLAGLQGAAPAEDQFTERICKVIDEPETSFGLDPVWPEGLPKEIPPFDGEIRSVLSGGWVYRIFYRNVTAAQVNRYADLLEAEGYAITAIVYIREGFISTSKEVNAIDAVKDGHKIRIEYGCDQADLMISLQ